jgi:hypothetical protein
MLFGEEMNSHGDMIRKREVEVMVIGGEVVKACSDSSLCLCVFRDKDAPFLVV